MDKKKNYFLICGVLVLIFPGLLILGYFWKKTVNGYTVLNKSNISRIAKPAVKIKDVSVSVDIADNDIKRAQGLSNRTGLGEKEGMLFIFPQDSQPFFWMKDMLIPLDIIWINDGKIIHIDDNVPNPDSNTPDYKLPLYSPPDKINYVLEVNAGFANNNGFKTGDLVEINIKK